MTREEMAAIIDGVRIVVLPSLAMELSEVAAELRKTCATCQHLRQFSDKGLLSGEHYGEHVAICMGESGRTPNLVPADGSGFCHGWEQKDSQ